MKKILLIFSFFLLLTACNKSTNYDNATKDFTLIRPDEIIEKNRNGDSFFLYVGRSTCPFCEIFVPKLKRASEDTDLEVFYLDVDNEEQKNLKVVLENYEIKYVPFLMYFENSKNESYLKLNEEEEIEVKEIENYLINS